MSIQSRMNRKFRNLSQSSRHSREKGESINREPSFSQSINRGNSWGKPMPIHPPTHRNIQETLALGSTHFFGQERRPTPKESEPATKPTSITYSRGWSLKKASTSETPPVPGRGEQEPDTRSRVGFERGPRDLDPHLELLDGEWPVLHLLMLRSRRRRHGLLFSHLSFALFVCSKRIGGRQCRACEDLLDFTWAAI